MKMKAQVMSRSKQLTNLNLKMRNQSKMNKRIIVGKVGVKIMKSLMRILTINLIVQTKNLIMEKVTFLNHYWNKMKMTTTHIWKNLMMML